MKSEESQVYATSENLAIKNVWDSLLPDRQILYSISETHRKFPQISARSKQQKGQEAQKKLRSSEVQYQSFKFLS